MNYLFTSLVSLRTMQQSHHSKLKSIIRTSHPRIWTFVVTLNDIIRDKENDIGRLRLGREISRPRKKVDIKNDVQRSKCKDKLREGAYSPWEFIQAIRHTIGHINADITETTSLSSDSEDEIESGEIVRSENCCVVCLSIST